MIFYFTGTGNSLALAKRIAEEQGEKLVSIAKELSDSESTFVYTLEEDEIIGFVYPVYAWAPPQLVLDFLDRIRLVGTPSYTFSLCNCAEEEGKTSDLFEKHFRAKGMDLLGVFTAVMPNNYILGFDADEEAVENRKLSRAEDDLKWINETILQRKPDRSMRLLGRFSFVKSYLINKGFNKYGLNPSKYYAEQTCNGCKLCEQICPVHTIKVNGTPKWGKSCTMCFACLNRCPMHAIQLGRRTIGKKRYVHPILRNVVE